MGTTTVDFPFTKAVDPRSGIEEHHLSFFLKYYLPAHRISELQEKPFFDSIGTVLEEYEKELKLSKPSADNLANVFASGSAAEGLLLPVFLNRTTGEKIFHSDFDILRVLPGVIASDAEYEGPDICFPMENASHPGFAKLVYKMGDAALEYVNSQDATKIIETLASNAELPNLTMFAHGPAVTSGSPRLRIEVDNVYAIKCNTWPKSANEWKTRTRRWDWPSADMINLIVSESCLLVPVGHRLSPEPQFEWRLSFSRAEKTLSQSLNVFQKKAYVLLKVLHREYFSTPKIIATYHLKTILFWMCERLPESFWSDGNMGRCLFALLDELITCLASHNLPNFFIPANNMISHVHSDFVKTILEKVLSLRRDPMGAILNFDLKHRLVGGPRKPWKVSIDFLIKTVRKAENDQEIIACYEYALIDISNLMVAQSGDVEWGSKEAFYFLNEAWNYQKLVCQSNGITACGQIQYIWNNLHSMCQYMSKTPTKVTLQRVSSMITYSITNCEMRAGEALYASALHSLAGTLHHAMAFWSPKFDFDPVWRPPSECERKEAKAKSEMHHKTAVELFPEMASSKTEYAKLLFHNGAFQEVISILEDVVIGPLDSVIEETTKIVRVELPTLETKLQAVASVYLVIQGGSLIVPNVVIALYYLVVARMKAGCGKGEVCELIEKLKLACEHKRNSASMFSFQVYKTLEEVQFEKYS